MNPTNKKEQADSIAQSIYDGNTDHEGLALQIKDLGANIGSPHIPNESDSENNSEKIGIYKSEKINGEDYFVRSDEDSSKFYLWRRSTEPIRKAKTTTKRILFFGESVARGLFYEPHYGPAQVLEEILNKTSSVSVEVVDLAVTSCSSVEILDLCRKALVLSGDTVVIMAGNNWKRQIILDLSPIELNAIYEEFTSGDPNFEKVNDQLKNGFDRLVDTFFSILNQLLKDKGIDVLFVLPEFNLMDFRSSELEQEMYMPNDKTAAWIEVKKKGVEAFNNADFAGLEIIAQELIELNPFHPIGYEWLADCKLKEGEVQAAKELLRSAYDKGIYRTTITFPRIYSGLKNAISRNCATHNIALLRLDEVFENQGKDGVPDRSLFLDYCHLTVEGIELSMKACAGKLVKIWNDVTVNDTDLDSFEIKTDPKILSIAHFLAALHNNLCGQSFEVVNYHCKKSYDYNNTFIKNMQLYMELAISKTPWKLAKKAFNFIENNLLDIGLIQYESHARIDSHIIRSIRGILDENKLQNNYSSILTEKYGSTTLDIDLLNTKFAVNSFKFISEIKEKGKAFYSEIDLKTEFNFFVTANNPINIKITLRIPHYSTATPVQISLNTSLIKEIDADTKWKTFNIPVSIAQLSDGLNSIAVQWPLPARNPKKSVTLGSVVDFEDAVSPILGELYQLNIDR